MTYPTCHIVGVFVGGPKTLRDQRGEWRSSIARDSVQGAVQLEMGGFVGDQVTQPYHGSLETAVCLHSLTHYLFWNSTLQMALQPGAVGENLTFDVADDGNVCVGDVLRIGSARIPISAPGTPCENQARHIGRPDWVKRTIAALRTGMYARVLAPGVLQVGDSVVLEARPNPGLTVYVLNHCYYQDYQPELVEQFCAAEGLME